MESAYAHSDRRWSAENKGDIENMPSAESHVTGQHYLHAIPIPAAIPPPFTRPSSILFWTSELKSQPPFITFEVKNLYGPRCLDSDL